MVAIMDADKEGFLRSTRSLIQTIGRAARNANGRVILYADKITDSMQAALDETSRRRQIQMDYNTAHNIVPKTVTKAVFAEVGEVQEKTDKSRRFVYNKSGGVMDADTIRAEIKKLTRKMHQAAEDLEFELAAEIRDQIHKMEDDAEREAYEARFVEEVQSRIEDECEKRLPEAGKALFVVFMGM